MKVQTTLALVTANILLASGCGSNQGSSGITQTTYGEAVKYSKVDVNIHPLDKTVCDPFNNIPASSLDQGIKASLYYSIAGTPRMYSSIDYTTLAKQSSQTLFFADLNVPTRMFTEGFATQTNDVLKDDSGNKLIEYFGVKFETVIKLASADDEGDYEFALLSDDGTQLKLVSGDVENPTLTTIINNDGDHPTRMGCATQTVHMTKDTTLPIQLTYYQGPRYHIANVMMWRKASVAGKDQACGQSGNEYWFDPNKNSVPLKPYNDLLARGWKVLTKDNFFIPKSASYNPCVQGTAPVITNFVTGEAFFTGVSLYWTTDIPATSQVKVVNKATGEVTLTAADNALRTSHNVLVSGLAAGTTYTAQAVSISEDLGNAMSNVIEFTTPSP
ncbi:MAG TPA: hypothetical protein VF412_15880 [Bdellovibrio sp.]|uniref:hypothetical protein n=1 Tax=Bdellovibrio sp. TaxID=28201 RepID=UPI002EEB5A9A